MSAPGKVEQWIHDNVGVTLLLVGIALVALGAFAVSEVAVSTALVTIGAVAMVLAVLLPRSEGQLKLGPGGLEVVLAAIEEKSDEKGLEADLRTEAIASVLAGLGASGYRVHGDISPQNVLLGSGRTVVTTNFDALIEKAIEDVTAMVDIDPAEVPADALNAVAQAAGLQQQPTVTHAQRRAGRGAPRWHLWTSAGRWRVSNTRHGWNARRLDHPDDASD